MAEPCPLACLTCTQPRLLGMCSPDPDPDPNARDIDWLAPSPDLRSTHCTPHQNHHTTHTNHSVHTSVYYSQYGAIIHPSNCLPPIILTTASATIPTTHPVPLHTVYRTPFSPIFSPAPYCTEHPRTTLPTAQPAQVTDPHHQKPTPFSAYCSISQ